MPNTQITISCCPDAVYPAKITAYIQYIRNSDGKVCIPLTPIQLQWDGSGWSIPCSDPTDAIKCQAEKDMRTFDASFSCGGAKWTYHNGSCQRSWSQSQIGCLGASANISGTLDPLICCNDSSGLGFNGEVQIVGAAIPYMTAVPQNQTCPALTSAFPIRYSSGEMSIGSTDISSHGFGLPWGHTRSFASRLSHSESQGHGYNWQTQQWSYLVIQSDGTVIVNLGSNSSLWFDDDGTQYVGRLGIKQTLTYSDATHRYYVRDLNDTVTEFDAVTRMFRKQTDAAGNSIEVTSLAANAYNFATVERTYSSGGSTIVERYAYQYDTSTNNAMLTQVTLTRGPLGGAQQNIARAVYTYYDGIESIHGAYADLQTATTQLWQDGAWQNTGTTLYRYYVEPELSSSSSSSSSSGATAGFMPLHLLKYVVNPATFARLAADPNVTDPLTASDGIVAQYADYYFEYDASRRVTREMVQGGSRSFEFAYTNSEFSDDYNHWKTKTVETLPDDSQNIVYANYAGQTMLKVHQLGDDQWCEFSKYDENANLILHANPSAISGYDEQYADLLHEVDGNYEFLKDHEGLIKTFDIHLPTGRVSASKIER